MSGESRFEHLELGFAWAIVPSLALITAAITVAALIA